MNVLDAIKERRSIRHFKNTPIENEKLEKVLEAARLSPSASNLQDWKFIVVKNQETRNILAGDASGQHFISRAPVTIVACATNPGVKMFCGQEKASIDLSIATAYMILEAQELGLGTCWIGHFDEYKVKQALDIPKNVSVVAMFPLGYPDENPSPRRRKSYDEIVCYESYQ